MTPGLPRASGAGLAKLTPRERQGPTPEAAETTGWREAALPHFPRHL